MLRGEVGSGVSDHGQILDFTLKTGGSRTWLIRITWITFTIQLPLWKFEFIRSE